MIEMNVKAKARRRGRLAFDETSEHATRADALAELRLHLGYVVGQTDDEYLKALADCGVAVTFKEVPNGAR